MLFLRLNSSQDAVKLAVFDAMHGTKHGTLAVMVVPYQIRGSECGYRPKAYDEFWHDLAHELRISENMDELARTAMTLKKSMNPES